MPINVIYNIRNVVSGNRNALLMLTMTQVKGNWLWCVPKRRISPSSPLAHALHFIGRAHVVMTYLITGLTFFVVWRNYSVRAAPLIAGRICPEPFLTFLTTVTPPHTGNRQAAMAVVPFARLPGHAVRAVAHGELAFLSRVDREASFLD